MQWLTWGTCHDFLVQSVGQFNTVTFGLGCAQTFSCPVLSIVVWKKSSTSHEFPTWHGCHPKSASGYATYGILSPLKDTTFSVATEQQTRLELVSFIYYLIRVNVLWSKLHPEKVVTLNGHLLQSRSFFKN